MANSSQFDLPDPPTDAISAVKFAPSSSKLLVASWDKHVYLYELDGGTSGKLLQKFEHRAPVLDVAWDQNETEFYSTGLDWDVRKVSIPSSEQEVLSSHEAGVKSLVYSAPHNLLISASWDSTLHLHNLHSSSSSACTVPLPHKPFSLSVSATKLVVAMSNRALHIYDLQAITLLSQQTAGAGSDENKYATLTLEPWQRRESSLKFMTRAVACMPSPHPHPPFTPTAESAEHDPDATGGYASSSIEGRVAVEYFSPEPAAQALKYAFKCHRQPAQDGSGADVVYPVNALAFHPVHGTFASGGGDGVVALWDGVGKRRIRQYQKLPASVAALSFSKDGRWLAVGVSPGFEDGKEGGVGDEVGLVKVVVRELAEGEAKGKDKDKDKAK